MNKRNWKKSGYTAYRRAAVFLAVSFLAGIFLAGCTKENAPDSTGSRKESPAEEGAENSGTADEDKPFGKFTSRTLDGGAVTQDIFSEAELTMVNIWGTFCGPCIREMPELGELSREYEGEGVQIVGLLCDVAEPEDETALAIVEETQADYRHIVSSFELQNGILGKVQAVPTTIFVDSGGKQVGDVYPGARDKESWKELIESLLGEVRDTDE